MSVLVGCGGHHGVDQAAVAIGTDVGFHAELPLVALLGLMHPGIAAAVLVLRRARGVDDGGVDKGALAHQHAPLLEAVVDRFENGGAKAAILQQCRHHLQAVLGPEPVLQIRANPFNLRREKTAYKIRRRKLQVAVPTGRLGMRPCLTPIGR